MRWSDRGATRSHRGEAQETPKCVMLTGPRNRRPSMPCRTAGETTKAAHRQEETGAGKI